MRKKTGKKEAAKRKQSKGLRVVVSGGVGFCSGVKRAIKMALDSAAESDQAV